MSSEAENPENQLGTQMSFLEHIDELRRRLVRAVLFIGLAFIFCWFASDRIYNFLAVPGLEVLRQAQLNEIKAESGQSAPEKPLMFSALNEGDTGRYVFDKSMKLGASIISAGTSVQAKAAKDTNGNLGLFTDEPIFTGNAIIPKGTKLPADFSAPTPSQPSPEVRMMVTTVQESFTLYVTVSLYTAIALSIPFLLWQIWGFISPALYRHERGYVTPFIGLSTISFVLGAAFAYYILFPPAVQYLIGLGEDFRVMLRATDYFDFVTLVMLAMGIIFQMPAITYVLARIGLVSANLLIKSWRLAIVVILIVAAVVSPTGDIPNLMLFATPMMILYLISIFIAWFFGRKRQPEKI
jgi:sec-independent protein translocase protein TatC